MIGTGILLMFYYVPSTEKAYDGMKDLQFVVSAGLVLRNMHRWAAHLMVTVVLLHMCRVFYTGAYKAPREFNWVIGVGLFLLTLGLSSYSAFWGGVAVPALLVTALVLLPYLDRRRHGVGRWFAHERWVASTVFSLCLLTAITFTIIGTFFRGPNWSWQEPWLRPPAAAELR